MRLENPPTLSVGIAIAHFMEPLDDLFRFARSAESAAKDNGRDSLAVRVHTRSGAPLHYRGRWNERPDRGIMSWAELLREGILPDKAAYDLRRLAAKYAGWPDNTPPSRQALQEAISADALRLLRRKRTQTSAAAFAKVEILIRRARTAAEVGKVANEILVARHSLQLDRHSLQLDVMTPHHPTYNLDGSAAPSDLDDPIPVPFLSVRGRFRIALECDVKSSEGCRWAQLALEILAGALKHWRLGGKTSSGYGRLV